MEMDKHANKAVSFGQLPFISKCSAFILALTYTQTTHIWPVELSS